MLRAVSAAFLLLSACFVDAFAPPGEGAGGVGEGATGAGASGTGGAGATGGDGTGGAATETICDDNVDQDEDGDVDCDDADCDLSAACPGDWQVVAVEVVPHGTPASAPCDSPTVLRFSKPSSSGYCSPCGCTTPATCTSPTIQCWFSNTSCSGPASNTTPMASGCTVGNLAGIPAQGNGSGACRLTAPATVATECTDSGSDVTSAGVAEDVHVCTNVPATVPEDKRCLRQAGEVACPTGFSNARTIFEDYVDTRSCSCDCESTCSGGGYVAYDNTSCTTVYDPPVSVLSTACTPTPNLWDYLDGSLLPILGTPDSVCAITETGVVSPTGVETLCCPD
jgi:hypothetical protein